MTDITELAQSLKRRATSANEFGESLYVKGADVIALVEALEKAQRYIEELREWNAGLAQESFERQQLISELVPIRAAAEKLVRCKGRYHSEQNYRALAALFGVTAPDLPPIDDEPCTVTVKLPDLRQIVSGDRYVWSDGVFNYSQDVKAILADAGIKVEDE